jgi:acyl-CoA thioesterase-2
MSQVLNQLVALLTLKPSENLFRGVSQDLGFRQLFGGQVLGNCVSAASQTVNAEHRMRSMHGFTFCALVMSRCRWSIRSNRCVAAVSTRRVTAIRRANQFYLRRVLSVR